MGTNCSLTGIVGRKLAEDLEGDLNEYFERNVKAYGAARAKLNLHYRRH